MTEMRKENKELCRTIEKYTDGLIFNACMNEIMETLSAAKTSKKDGKGNRYVELMRGHVPLIDAVADKEKLSLEGLVYAKCLLSIYLDSSNSRETRCVSWVLSTSVCSTGSFSAHTATYSTSENAHETHRVSLELRNLNTHLIQTSCNVCELPPYVVYCIYLKFDGKGWRMIWRHREKNVH